MRPCEFCGYEIPEGAHFCGRCGQAISEDTKSATFFTAVVEPGTAAPATPPVANQPFVQGIPPYEEWPTEANSDPAAGLIAPWSALGMEQFHQAQAPMVQGTPQVGHVPFISGTPSAPTDAAPSYAAPSQRGSQASRASRASRASQAHSTHAAAASVSKVAAGTAAKWLIVAMAAVLVLATSGAIFVLASAPGLSLTGSGSVAVGGTLHIHGKGFLPGGSVSLFLDAGIPVSAARTNSLSRVGRRQLVEAGEDDVFAMSQGARSAASNLSIPVSVAGTFDADIQAQSSWSAGQHTLHAVESLGSRSADLVFTMLSSTTPSKLVVQPATLAFRVPQGSQAVQSLGVSNAGQATLNWTASTDGSPWLLLQNTFGEIGSVASNEFIDVTADASHLTVGSYSASIQVDSNGGQVRVAVSLQVLPPAQKKQAQLDVTPTSLDFGSLMIGQKQTQAISLGNSGTADLNWNASVGSASWLTLDATSGTVKQGALPQMLHVSVDTSSLLAGSYTATLAITSNGGNAHVTISLVVTGISPTPSPTLLQPSPSPTLVPTPSPTVIPSPSPSPTVLPPAWSVSPTSLDASTCAGSCTVTLTENASSTGSIGWTASSDVNAVFKPANGTLSPGVPQQVSISGAACQSGTFTFTATGTASPQALTVAWTCTTPPPTPTPTPTPTGTASLGSCSYTAGTGWSCPLNLAASSNNSTAWAWSAAGSGISGITVTPPNGSLPPGQTTMATVAIPDGICPASATITVSNPGPNIPLSWSCTAPTLTVTVNTPSCPSNSSGGWTCTDTLSLAAGSQGQLAWTSSASSNLPNVAFSPPGGTLSVGQSTPVTITVPSADCVSGTFYFTGTGGNTANVTWTCSG
jgi:hypothetical protein